MDELLGEGKEGAVYRQGDEVVKFFKPGVFSDETGARLIELVKALPALPRWGMLRQRGSHLGGTLPMV